MKTVIFFAILLRVFSATGQEMNPKYDSVLARTLGADAKGMKMYVLGILKTGSNNTQDKKVRDSLVNGHIKHITWLAEKGDLIAAGGLGKNENSYRGVFILNVSSFEEANKLLEADPAIKENIFVADLYKWTTSAALTESPKIHGKIVKYNTK